MRVFERDEDRLTLELGYNALTGDHLGTLTDKGLGGR